MLLWACLRGDDECSPYGSTTTCRCVEVDAVDDIVAIVQTGVSKDNIDEYVAGLQSIGGQEVVATSMLRAQLKEAEMSSDSAWTRLLSEYEMQNRVWENVEFEICQGLQSDLALLRHQGAVARIRSKLDFAISMRAMDPEYAAQALEALLDVAEGNMPLNHTFLASVRDTIRSESTTRARRALLKRLRADCEGLDAGVCKDTLDVSACCLQAIHA
mmetsp:Transcript_119010/g.337389  ORF Transcript_119010/g.337389 Transcript_119010/m.337389 type:complete len:215 (-) Transcript_119010:211-855(-)